MASKLSVCWSRVLGITLPDLPTAAWFDVVPSGGRKINMNQEYVVGHLEAVLSN